MTLAELDEGAGAETGTGAEVEAGVRTATGCEGEGNDDAAGGGRRVSVHDDGVSVGGVGDDELMRTCGPYGSTNLRTCAATDMANTSLSIPDLQCTTFFPLDGGSSPAGLSLSVWLSLSESVLELGIEVR